MPRACSSHWPKMRPVNSYRRLTQVWSKNSLCQCRRDYCCSDSQEVDSNVFPCNPLQFKLISTCSVLWLEVGSCSTWIASSYIYSQTIPDWILSCLKIRSMYHIKKKKASIVSCKFSSVQFNRSVVSNSATP